MSKEVFSKIESGKLLFIINKYEDITLVRNDLCSDEQFLQVSTKKLDDGSSFKPHRHNTLLRNTEITQEVWIVMKGKIKVKLYDIDDTLLLEEDMCTGDCVVTLYGGHCFDVIEKDTILYEIKNGPYRGQEKDKTLI